jgi:hypothetical protein
MLDANVLTNLRSEFSPGLLPRLRSLLIFVMTLAIGLISAPHVATAQAAATDGGHSPDEIRLFPATASLLSKGKQQFTAAVTGTSDTRVKWSTTAGSVSKKGLYTAPSVTSPTSVTLTATHVASGHSVSASLTVKPLAAQAPQITTGALPQGEVGGLYSAVFTATGGTAPYVWSISAGNPPPGPTLNTAGALVGTPTATGTFSFTAMVTDAANQSTTGNFSVSVVSGNGYDGPAQLPIAVVAYAVADTPAPGNVINVSAGGDLQSALNSAQCGDTISLQAGATFTGAFEFPALNCNSSNWIVVRTSSPDTALPPEGQRITPCYAGVASLVGRPQYPCGNNPQNVMAKLELDGISDGPVIFRPGANHYRLLGLELTRATGVPIAPSLISVGQKGVTTYIVVDRCWVHGTPEDDTRDGFNLAGTAYVATVDSYFTDFHCTALTGRCTDAHAVSGGVGTHQDGPYLIQNNFLEASAEAILFGGGAATTAPADITISLNHFFKPWQWRPGNTPFQGGYSGNAFVVKNHLELKNATRVLAEANLMEDVWGGFSQQGYAIVLTPVNQPSRTDKALCPLCAVTDVTIRYTHITHAGGGIVMATPLERHGKGKGGAAATAGNRWSIHDIVLDDISRSYNGTGRLFYLANGWPKNPVNTVTINHITGFPDVTGGFMFTGNNKPNQEMYGFVFTNNIVIAGPHPLWEAEGGDASCAISDFPLTILNKCFTTYTFNYNAFLGVSSHFPPSTWPAGNLFGAGPETADFVDYNNGNGGNYELLPASPYKNAGNDGKDLGADIVGLTTVLTGVE